MRLIFIFITFFTMSQVQADSLGKGLAAIQSGDFQSAYGILKPLADNDNLQAQYNIGVMYMGGYGVQQDCLKAKEYFHKAATKGDIDAQLNYAFIHVSDNCKPNNYSIAIKWYEIAVKNGSDIAMHKLGHIYQEGLGVSKDLTKAESYYVNSAKLNNAEAMYALGAIYLSEGPKQDLVKSLAWFIKSKKMGDVNAAPAIEVISNVLQPTDIKRANTLATSL